MASSDNRPGDPATMPAVPAKVRQAVEESASKAQAADDEHDDQDDKDAADEARAQADAAGRSAPVPVADLADDGDAADMFKTAGFGQRYARGELLGAGGMGEVRSFSDRATGRTIAMKTIRGDIEGHIPLRRFAREARIQAQLEHPSVVPVYDVGVGPDGALFFTMKRVRGESLALVLVGLAARDPEFQRRYSMRKLLTVLSGVAMTLEYAHQRGVIHRDLKPGNIMLGAFGEVYVIDWGLADVRDRKAPPMLSVPPPPGSGPLRLAQLIAAAGNAAPLVDSSQRPETAAGLLLGTPGYVAPELVNLGTDHLDHRCDIYALGAILFEVLTLERLHKGEQLAQVLGSTVETDGASPRERAPSRNVPPELDALCKRATRLEPSKRPQTAAAFARVIESYLDGDRDLEQRRRLAGQSADVAAAALQRSKDDGPNEAATRALALRETMTALGLDPENARARGTLVRLLTEPGRDTARLAEEANRDVAVRAFRLAARNAIYALLTYLVYVPIILWMGVRHWWMLGALAASISGVIGMTWYYHQRPPPGLRLPLPHLAMSTIALAFGVVLFGPLVVLPAVVIANGVAYMASFERRTTSIVAASIGVIVVPVALELIGVLPKQYDFVDGTLRILPSMTRFPPAATLTLLLITNVIVIAGALLYVGRLRRGANEAERRLRTQAWQLSQIVPEDARSLLSSSD